MNIPRLAVQRPVTTSMVFIGLVLLGLFSLNRLAIDLIPEISFPSLTVSTSYSGVAPEEIERLITVPVEQALATISGVTGMQSFSSEGNSRVTLNFSSGTNLDVAANEVRAAVDQIRSRLPSDASAPRVVQFDPNQSPIMTIGLSGDMDPGELRRLAEGDFIYYLERLDGVAAVTLQGGRSSEVRVVLDPVRLQGHRLTLDQVVQAIRSENLNVPAGRIRVGQAQFTLRTIGELDGLDALSNILIANRDGVQTRLRDIAEIEGVGDDTGTIVRVDGLPGAVLSVQKQSGANTVAVADAVLATLEELKQRYPEISSRPLNDTSVFIRNAVNNVIMAGIYGGILACFILLVFLRSLRSTLIIAVAIPISLVTSFILIERAGMTLNTMSLGGLALGVGLLLDNSIIVLENVFRHQKLGKSPKEAAIDGSAEMTPAIIAATLTTFAVFLPMLFLTGMSGILFRQLGLMVAFSVGCSLLVALTLLPVMCSRMLKDIQEGSTGVLARLGRWFERTVDRGEESYGGVLQSLVYRPGLVTIVSILLFAGSLALVPFLGSELLPQTDEGDIGISVSLPTGTRIEVTDELILHIEDMVRERVPELLAMDSRVGSGSSTHSGSVNLTLVPRSERNRSTQEVVADLREVIADIPGITSRVSARSNFAARLASGSFGGGGSDRISVAVQGQDLDLLRKVAGDLQQIIAEVPGVTNVSISRDSEQPEFVVRVDRERASDLGLTTTQVANAVQTAVQGRVATQLRVNGREQTVRVVFKGMDRASTADIESLAIPVGGGQYVPLSSVGALVQQDSPRTIQRLNQQRTVQLNASPEGRDLGSVVADIRDAVNAYTLPQGVTIHFGGEYEEQQRAFREMLLVLLLAVSLVYIVMASQFESLFDPLIVMFSVPFAIVGVVMTLFLTQTPLTTQAFMGLIMLGGIVVNNAIVLVSYINILRDRGVPLDEAVVEGSRTRLRPVLMTTLSTILGLVPLALEFGEGAEVQAPLARTVIGGLIVSTLVTLVLIPTLYRWAHQLWNRRSAKRTKGAPPVTVTAGVFLGLIVTWLFVGTPVYAQQGEPSQRLTPDLAIEWALEHHPQIAQARRNLQTAESGLRELQAAYKPDITVDAGWAIREPLSGSGTSLNGGEISVTAREVFLTGPKLGQRNVALAQAETAVYLAQLGLKDEIQSITLSVLTAYVNVLKAQQSLKVSEKAVQRAEQALDLVEVRFELGMAGHYDVLQAKTQVASTKTQVESSRRRLDMAWTRLNRAMGKEDNYRADLAGLEDLPELDGVEQLSDGHVEAIYDRRLEVIRARVQLDNAKMAADARVSDLSPTATLTGNINGADATARVSWNNRDRNTSLTVNGTLYEHGGGLPGGGVSSPPNWGVELRVSWPLYDGGIEKEKALQESLRLEQLEQTLKEQQQAVALDVTDAHYAWLDAVERVRLVELQVEAAKERLRQVQARMEIGAETPNSLFDAEYALLQAERDLNEARWDRMLARARVERALGQSVWPSPDGK